MTEKEDTCFRNIEAGYPHNADTLRKVCGELFVTLIRCHEPPANPDRPWQLTSECSPDGETIVITCKRAPEGTK